MPGTFDLWTVLFSFTIASLAGFVAFESMEHTRYSPQPAVWTMVSGLTLGLGIWSMHFVGMLAWQPPFPLYYSITPTVLSVLVAILSSWLAMYLTVSNLSNSRNIVLGSFVVGAGICSMHYIGMDALKFSEPVAWSVPGVALSFVIAIFASLGAMAMLRHSGSFSVRRQVAASLVIAVAICGMHYTGMLAMMLPAGAVSVQQSHEFSGASLARVGVGNALVFMACLLVVFYRDKVRLLESTTQAQQQAVAAARTAERMGAAGRIAASIAHEINNPLEAVTNLLYLAENGTIGSEERKYLQTAQDELRRIAEITTHTLKFYRQPYAPAQTSLVELMESTLAVFQNRLEKCRIVVVREWDPATPSVYCRAGEIRQVLANFVGNAIDSMHAHGGTLTLKISPAPSGGCEMLVSDTGGGISADDQRRILEPFFTTKGAGGTGLGLSICAEIIQRHGGTLDFESSTTPGRSGTTFRILLPAQMPSDPAKA
ncbi:MHYT domain-containing protein [Terriglobus sp. TAA 43]|uniref:MHYT domain-containing protein n=1 Tax=Terriglobus sp. TAA 43 TaxID=278961 RepID=UPI00068B3FFD|nr:MHYT domain-containing protein [Terriglobus sp. TAA 43]